MVAGWVKYVSKRDLSDRMGAFQVCLWELWCRHELPDSVTYDKSGKPAGSWRFACYVWVNGGGSATVKMVDTTVPWDSGTLEKWQRTISPEYCLSGTTETNVMAVVGEGTGFEKGKRFHERDLPGDLVLILEVQGTGVHWRPWRLACVRTSEHPFRRRLVDLLGHVTAGVSRRLRGWRSLDVGP